MNHRIAPLLVFAFAAVVAGCGKGGANAQKGAPASPPLILATEDVHVVKNTALTSGPSITGTIQPERRADVRAEVAAIVLQVYKENGDNVRRGDILVRLDETAFKDAMASAEAAVRAATQAHEQSGRQFERMKTLRASGMSSAQQLEDAEVRQNAAQSDLEAAKARLVLARQAMGRTEVRAPFDGVVSERKVSAGDTASVGKELIKVIDPSSMRFEGLVSADHIGQVQAGQNVGFRVNGYGEEEFTGKVRRVNPAANATTRQVEVLVDFTGTKQPKLSGLYAEGRIETGGSSALTIPATAVVRDGEKASAFRVLEAKLQKAPITLGERDPRTGEFAVKEGLKEGDKVVRYPSALLKDGQTIQAAAQPRAAVTEARK